MICSIKEPKDNNDKSNTDNDEQDQRGCLDKFSSMFFYSTETVKNTSYNLSKNLGEKSRGTIDVIKNAGFDIYVRF